MNVLIFHSNAAGMQSSLQEFILRDQIATSSENPVSPYSILNADPDSHAGDFATFLSYTKISERAEELSGLLFPVFLQLALSLSLSSSAASLRSFLAQHGHNFSHKQLELLAQLPDIPPDLAPYTQHKYAVRLSHCAYSHLQTFLSDNPDSSIHLPLQANIHIQVGSKECDDSKKPQKKTSSKSRPSSSPSKRVSASNPSLEALRGAASQLSALPPSSSVLHLTLPPDPSLPHAAALCFSRSFLLSGHADGSLLLSPFSLPTSDLPCPPCSPGELHGHPAPVYSVSVSQSGAWAVSGAGNGCCRLWRLQEPCGPMAEYVGHQSPVWSVCLPRQIESGHFASASQDGTARLWSAELLFPLRIFAGHYSAVNCVDLHPNCVYLATGGQDGSCRLWNSQDGSCVRLLTGGRSAVSCLSFSPDGKLVATGCEEGVVRVWSIAESRVVRELPASERRITQLDFSPDSNSLSSISQDRTLRLWDLTSPQSSSPFLTVSTGRSLPLACSYRRVNLCALVSIENV